MIDELDVINQRSRAKQEDARSLSLLHTALDKVTDLAKRQALPEEISVDNLDEIKAHLRSELTVLAQRLEKALKAVNVEMPTVKIAETIAISNIGDLGKTLTDIKRATETLANVVEKFNFDPTVNISTPDVIVPEIKVPEVKIPPIIVPTPEVTVNPKVDLDLSELLKALKPLGYISNKASNPISVRLSNGQEFVKALKEVAQKSGQIVHAFANSAGMSVDEYRTTVRASDDILASYKCADVDADASPNYYGFVDKDGNWYILKETISAGADTYRYAKGGSGYETPVTGAWATRASLSYGYFHNVF